MNDMEVLRRAYDHEHDSRNRLPPDLRSWEYYTIGASREDVRRLVEEGMLIIALKNSNLTKYKLSQKGRDFVFATTMEREMARIPAATIVEAMSLIVGFDDIKDAISKAIESQRPTLVRDIAMLLTRLGISPGIQRRSHDARAIVIRQCDAARFMDKVGTFRETKSVSTAVLMHDESFKVPFPFDADSAQSLICSLRKGRRSQSLTRRAAIKLLGTTWPRRLQTLLNGDIRWVRVEHIRRFNEPGQVVYDLSVPKAETFVLGNRVLVHNCAKSIMLEGVRSAVPGAYIAFGSRTSASGLSEALFEHQQIKAARAAALAIIESHAVGLKDVTVSLSGHGNPQHEPQEGWANDFISVNVNQK